MKLTCQPPSGGFKGSARWHSASGGLVVLLVLLLTACNAVNSEPNTPAPTRRAAFAASVTPAVTAAPDAPTLTPFVWPTLPPSPTPVCPNTPRTRLILQERGRVLPDDPRPVNLREGPGTDKEVKAMMPVRALFFVLDGPVCNNGYSWFKVRYQEIEGWIAEGDRTSYYVEPYFPG